MTKFCWSARACRSALVILVVGSLGLFGSVAVSEPATAAPTTLTISADVVQTRPGLTNQITYPHTNFLPATLPVVHSNGGGGSVDAALTFSQTAVNAAATNAGYTVSANTVLCSLSYTFSGSSVEGSYGMTITAFNNSGTQSTPKRIPEGISYRGIFYQGIYFRGGFALGGTVEAAGSSNPGGSITVVSPETQPASSATVRALSSSLNIAAFTWDDLRLGRLTIFVGAIGGANPYEESVRGITATASVAERDCNASATSGARESPSSGISSAIENPAIALDIRRSPGRPAGGMPIDIAGLGIPPGTPYTLSVFEPELRLDSGVASGGGSFGKTVPLPELPAGIHTVVLKVVLPSGEILQLSKVFEVGVDGLVVSIADTVIGVPVVPSASEKLASTGVASSHLPLFSMMLLVLGLLLVLYSRRARAIVLEE